MHLCHPKVFHIFHRVVHRQNRKIPRKLRVYRGLWGKFDKKRFVSKYKDWFTEQQVHIVFERRKFVSLRRNLSNARPGRKDRPHGAARREKGLGQAGAPGDNRSYSLSNNDPDGRQGASNPQSNPDSGCCSYADFCPDRNRPPFGRLDFHNVPEKERLEEGLLSLGYSR